MPEEEEFEQTPLETEDVTEEEVTPTGTAISHTVDEMPELSGKQIGDTVMMRIDNVSDDGNTYELSIAEEPAVGPETGAPSGRDAVEAALLS